MHIPAHLSIQTLVSISTLLTILAPYIAAIFTQDHLPQWVNELIAVVVSVTAGIVSFVVSGGHFDTSDMNSLWIAISAIVVGAKVYYVKLLPNSPLIKAIEYATGGLQAGASVPSALFPSAVSKVQVDALPVQATDTDASGE